MFKILKNIKNLFVHIRSSIKLILIVLISGILITGIISIFYKPTYAVTINGDAVGYTDDKNGLQKKINEYMQGKEEENIAFIDIETLPEYSLCFVKRNNISNSEEIFNKIASSGTTYYEYYAITLKDEEKYYVATKTEAEDAIKTLKDKDSTNIDDIGYTQKYGTEEQSYTDQATIVAGLYKKRIVNTTPYFSGTITTAKLDLGISLIKPIASGYTITSRFGQRSSGTHTGLDIAAPMGTNIHAAASGTVVTSGWSDYGYGYHVVISHGNGVYTLYGHCSRLYANVGDVVNQGDTIAAVGSTGNSTGPHLHLEIRVNGQKLNPQYYLY